MSAANLSDAEKVVVTRALLDQGQTEDFDKLKDDLAKTAGDAAQYTILEARPLKFPNRLNPVLRALTFMPSSRADPLLRAINHFKSGEEPSSAQTVFLHADQKAALIREDGTLRASLYKVLVFQAVTTAIESEDLNLAHFCQHRPWIRA